jgi:general secretion pathway protein F/type IV pilus assembly protein PilC
MPLFKYRAISGEGKNFNGVVEADSLSVAKEKLRKNQVYITELIAVGNQKKELTLSFPLLLAFTRELAQLLKAGLPLYESLVTIEEKYRKNPKHSLFVDLCDHLKSGSHLSLALKKYPQTFHPIYLSMVQAGEQSGNLAEVFEQLAQLLHRQQSLKKQLASALTYPAFLAAFCFLIVCALTFFIIPSMRELFEGRDVHPLTRVVLSVSLWANEHIPFLLGSFCTIPLLIGVLMKRATTRLYLHRLSFQIPFVKTILLQSALVRFCRTLSMLLGSGVPLLEALAHSRKMLNNLLLEQVVQEAEKKIIEGQRLSAALQSQTILPPLVTRMLALAEETGKMKEAFLNLSVIYEEELEKHLSQLTTFLQPVMLMILGGIVGLVILSILLPLTDVNSFINS